MSRKIILIAFSQHDKTTAERQTIKLIEIIELFHGETVDSQISNTFVIFPTDPSG